MWRVSRLLTHFTPSDVFMREGCIPQGNIWLLLWLCGTLYCLIDASISHASLLLRSSCLLSYLFISCSVWLTIQHRPALRPLIAQQPSLTQQTQVSPPHCSSLLSMLTVASHCLRGLDTLLISCSNVNAIYLSTSHIYASYSCSFYSLLILFFLSHFKTIASSPLPLPHIISLSLSLSLISSPLPLPISNALGWECCWQVSCRVRHHAATDHQQSWGELTCSHTDIAAPKRALLDRSVFW